jgi:uncharacterized membrane protein YGL010W
MNSTDLELAIACLGALAWIVQTALTDPVEGVIVLGLMYLTVHLAQRVRSRRGRLTLR